MSRVIQVRISGCRRLLNDSRPLVVVFVPRSLQDFRPCLDALLHSLLTNGIDHLSCLHLSPARSAGTSARKVHLSVLGAIGLAYSMTADLQRLATDDTVSLVLDECVSYRDRTTSTSLDCISVSDNVDQVLTKIQTLPRPHEILITGNFYAIGIFNTLIEQDAT